jgi:hypothetical protein
MVSKRMTSDRASLSNAAIAALLALAAEIAKMALQKATACLPESIFWTEEAVILAEQGLSLTELPAIVF